MNSGLAAVGGLRALSFHDAPPSWARRSLGGARVAFAKGFEGKDEVEQERNDWLFNAEAVHEASAPPPP